ncbi:MAG: amino acid-binding protein [Hamadaea sp.]|nr:amino acid-binding protein [Hamadaea sp.]NUR48287.1 amino acid-binding protein [Hamadaea sp.]NUT07605.1 amino acid-binding protein [Hamadaea sp.]
MLLRIRVALPDRPGSLGQVARTLGVAGADIVQVVVLERAAGRAVDDFTVVWPSGASVRRLLAGLGAMPGVRVDGVWQAIGAPVHGGNDAELLAQIAVNPIDGLGTLVDAVPTLLAAEWAAVLVVPADWAVRNGSADGLTALSASIGRAEPAVAHASWRAPQAPRLPEVTPLRARALTGPDGTRYAVAPFGRAGLVLVVARGGAELPPEPEPAFTNVEALPTPTAAAFHATEVDRIAQLVRAAALVLGDQLDLVTAPPVAKARVEGISSTS